MSRMHNPAHPGEVLREWIPEDMTVTQAARELQISRVTLSKVLNGKAGITASMALRLSAWLGKPGHLAGDTNTVGFMAGSATTRTGYKTTGKITGLNKPGLLLDLFHDDL